mmetsp:Transcript_42194/g.77124  ORF Transcript_42194/g.77124 Transcript_42194/m.77124 type:complete len:465 (+) Transcript_42194:667-2061(+)
MSRSPPNFSFGDDTSPVRTGQRHRRGRGYPSRNNAAPANRNTAANSSHTNNRNNGAAPANHSSHQSGHHGSSAAARLSNQSSLGNVNLNQRPQTHYSSDGWDNPPASSNKGNNGNNDDANSLTYSASSSVQSAESSSNSSSFAEILKHIDSEFDLKDYSDPEIKEFMARQSKAANDASGGIGQSQYGKMKGMGMEMETAPPPPAVAMWKQRTEERSRQQAQMQQAQQQQQGKKKQNQFSMAARAKHTPSSGHFDFNYSKDDSSEDDVHGVQFNEYEENVLETIAGLDHDDDGVARHTVTVTSVKPRAVKAANTHRDQNFFNQDPFQSPYNSAPSSPGRGRSTSSPRSSGHITPPPNSKNKRNSYTSTPPGANSISRTSSRHSKSSSDGSFESPAPSSPPLAPHGRSPPASGKTRRKSSGQREEKKVVTEDVLAEQAFYAKPWMCGFTDAITDVFNLDGFDKFQK